MQLRVVERSLSDPYRRYASDVDAIMFCEETIRSIGPGKILRGDATGNCCRAIAGLDCKRISFYAFAVYVRKVILPVLEFISTEHNVMNTSVSLKRCTLLAITCRTRPCGQ